MGMPSGFELFIIVAIIVLLFGGKKIPELAKGLGKGIKDFKNAVKEDEKPEVMTTNEKEIDPKETKTETVKTETTTTQNTTETKQV